MIRPPLLLALCLLLLLLLPTPLQSQPTSQSTSPLAYFQAQSALRRTPPPPHSLLNVYVSPFGHTTPSQHPQTQSIPATKVSITLNLNTTTPSSTLTTLLHTTASFTSNFIITICLYSEFKQAPLTCNPISHPDIKDILTVNLGPEAGGYYLVTATISVNGIEYSDPSAVGSHSFEIAAGSIVTSFCSVTSPSELSLYTESPAAPPILPPASLCADYTIGDTIPVSRWYFDDKTDHDESYQPRSLAEISNFMAAVTRKEQFYYGMTDTWLYAALEKFPIENKRVLLMGSNVPWYEAICLVYKALECVTLEYNELQYEHPKLNTVTVSEFEKNPAKYGKFDQVWSISSFEHDGLGRYGDPLNPNGDVEAVAKVKQYLKPDGVFMFCVPIGKDEVRWNEGRVYGRVRLPLMLEGFDVIDTEGVSDGDLDNVVRTHSHQPIFVLGLKKSGEL